jgi:hypothetical protein
MVTEEEIERGTRTTLMNLENFIFESSQFSSFPCSCLKIFTIHHFIHITLANEEIMVIFCAEDKRCPTFHKLSRSQDFLSNSLTLLVHVQNLSLNPPSATMELYTIITNETPPRSCGVLPTATRQFSNTYLNPSNNYFNLFWPSIPYSV